jgi:hypothetical protein
MGVSLAIEYRVAGIQVILEHPAARVGRDDHPDNGQLAGGDAVIRGGERELCLGGELPLTASNSGVIT